MNAFRCRLAAVLAATGLCALNGCTSDGPELGQVRGKITLDGRAVPYAYVQFMPIDPPGTYGSAFANVNGEYELQFSLSRKGAPVGRHEVTVRTARRDEIEMEDKATGKMVLPDLPPGYRPNVSTTFEREVVKGANVLDFAIDESFRKKKP